jgi:predicted metalloprotease with PDZ domain
VLLGAWLLIAAALAGSDPESIGVRLDLSRDAEGRPLLRLHAEYPGGDVDLTGVTVETGDGDGPDCDVRLVAARDLEGRALQVDPGGPGRWLVHHPLGARFRIEARLGVTATREHSIAREYSRAVFDERVLHAGVGWVLPLPEGLERDRVRPVRLEWTGCEGLGWEAACSLGGGMGPLEARLTSRELKACLLVAGEVELFDYEVPAGTLLVAAAGDAWGFDRIEFAELARDVTIFERAYFDDTSSPFRLVSLLPRGVGPFRRDSQSGVALHRASAIFSPPGVAFSGPDGRRTDFALVLLHEAFHGWSAKRWDFDPGERPSWFIEGFADFYGRRLALRGSLIDLAAYVEDLNRVLREYARSPALEEVAAREAPQVVSDAIVHYRPYLLGDLIAVRVDAAIRARSAGARNLDDCMRDLVREAQASPGGRLAFARWELFERLETWCGIPLDDVRKSVVLGRPFELPAYTFEPVLELETVEIGGGETMQRAKPRPGMVSAALECL